jgi:hypothetical protein
MCFQFEVIGVATYVAAVVYLGHMVVYPRPVKLTLLVEFASRGLTFYKILDGRPSVDSKSLFSCTLRRI